MEYLEVFFSLTRFAYGVVDKAEYRKKEERKAGREGR